MKHIERQNAAKEMMSDPCDITPWHTLGSRYHAVDGFDLMVMIALVRLVNPVILTLAPAVLVGVVEDAVSSTFTISLWSAAACT